MQKFKKIKKTIQTTESVTCDKCGKEFNVEEDIMEIQEFLHINFIGGYNSIFGDGTRVTCDICQRCLKDMIEDICEMTQGDF
jgi:hypothetical protein